MKKFSELEVGNALNLRKNFQIQVEIIKNIYKFEDLFLRFDTEKGKYYIWNFDFEKDFTTIDVKLDTVFIDIATSMDRLLLETE